MTTIRAVEAIPLQLPLERPITSALGSYPHVDLTVVLLHTDDGSTGTGFNAGLGGSASPAVAAYVEHELAPLALGEDPLRPEALWQRLWRPNKARLAGGIGVWALSAVDIACWDLLAQTADLPLHRLLGGFRDEVPVYGSGGWHNLDDGELVAEAQSFAELGITAYKYKVGSPRDRERTELLRKEMGEEFTLLADANQGYDVREAVEASWMLAEHGVGWLEEPVLALTPDDLAEVAARSRVPVAAGENVYFSWGFRQLCERKAAAFLQPDVARCGGISELRRVAALAETHRLSLSSHLWHELSISLVGASPAGWMAEYAPLVPPGVLTRPFPVVDGAIRLPDVAGHGVAFEPDALARFRL